MIFSSLQNMLQNPYSSTLSFTVALFLFFLPFSELKCKASKPVAGISVSQNAPPVKITGVGMIRGKVENGENYQLSKGENVWNDWISTVPFAIVAFSAGIIGFVFSLINFKERPVAIVVTAMLAAISLLVVRFTFVGNLDPGLHLLNEKLNNPAEVSFTLWFYLSFTSFLISALAGYMQGLSSLTEEYPTDYQVTF